MTRFKGFTTKEEALTFKKKHGGHLCHMEKYSRSKTEYLMCVKLGGLNKDKYPYALTWGVLK